MFDDCVGGPGFDGLGVAEVAVGCGEGSHAGGSAGGDVPDVVANVDAAGRFDARYFAGVEELRPLILADQNNEAREYLAARLHPVLGEYKTAIGALVESEKNAINDNAKDAAVTYAGTRNLLLGLGVVALLLSACLGWLITRSLVRELGGEPQVAAKMARAVAEGDFTQAITVRPGDQTTRVRHQPLQVFDLLEVATLNCHYSNVI